MAVAGAYNFLQSKDIKKNIIASNSDCEVTCQHPIGCEMKWNEMLFLDLSS